MIIPAPLILECKSDERKSNSHEPEISEMQRAHCNKDRGERLVYSLVVKRQAPSRFLLPSGLDFGPCRGCSQSSIEIVRYRGKRMMDSRLCLRRTSNSRTNSENGHVSIAIRQNQHCLGSLHFDLNIRKVGPAGAKLPLTSRRGPIIFSDELG